MSLFFLYDKSDVDVSGPAARGCKRSLDAEKHCYIETLIFGVCVEMV